jgi:large subunit ribosomal protein L30
VAKSGKKLKLTLIKSRFHRKPSHRQCLVGLGLRNRHQTVVVADTPENRGMVDEVNYLLRVEEA